MRDWKEISVCRKLRRFLVQPRIYYVRLIMPSSLFANSVFLATGSLTFAQALVMFILKLRSCKYSIILETICRYFWASLLSPTVNVYYDTILVT